MAHIAVVDDDPSMRTALERLLRAAAFHVVTFRSAEEFLGSSGQVPIICVLLNIHLGGMTGFELREHLVASGSHIPIVFMTAYDDAATRERVRMVGGGYLRKPFNRAELIEGIRNALRREG